MSWQKSSLSHFISWRAEKYFGSPHIRLIHFLSPVQSLCLEQSSMELDRTQIPLLTCLRSWCRKQAYRSCFLSEMSSQSLSLTHTGYRAGSSTLTTAGLCLAPAAAPARAPWVCWPWTPRPRMASTRRLLSWPMLAAATLLTVWSLATIKHQVVTRLSVNIQTPDTAAGSWGWGSTTLFVGGGWDPAELRTGTGAGTQTGLRPGDAGPARCSLHWSHLEPPHVRHTAGGHTD